MSFILRGGTVEFLREFPRPRLVSPREKKFLKEFSVANKHTSETLIVIGISFPNTRKCQSQSVFMLTLSTFLKLDFKADFEGKIRIYNSKKYP
jgi:hypothetical protein